MSKPYIVCHMMMSVDGRIDCEMTTKMAGTEEYYETLTALNTPATLSGRKTAQLEMAEQGEFVASNKEAIGKVGFFKKHASEYSIVVDTKGSLRWLDYHSSKTSLIIITSEQASKEYLAYLEARDISWIACGKEKIDLVKAMELLNREFGVERLAIVGGGSINGGFLDAGLLDEVSILLGPGIDGRKGMTSVFDGLPMDRELVTLKLESVTPYDNGAIWLRYFINK